MVECLFCCENAENNNLCAQCNQVIQFFNLDGRAPAGQGDNVDQLTDVMGNMGLNESWNLALKEKLIEEKPNYALINSMRTLRNALYVQNHNSVPQNGNIFRAFRCTPLNEMKMVIVGLDPSPNPRLQTGLAFSLDEGMDFQDREVEGNSNYMIIRSLLHDYGIQPRAGIMGSLLTWARSGVLLLNRALTLLTTDNERLKREWWVFTLKMLEIIKERKPNCGVIFFGRTNYEVYESYRPGQRRINEATIVFNHEIVGEHPAAYYYKENAALRTASRDRFIAGEYFTKINGKVMPEYKIDWAAGRYPEQ